MKSLVFFSCVIVFAHALDQALIDEVMEKIQTFGMECVEEEHTPQEDIEALIQKKPPKTHEGKCTIFCVMKKFNIMADSKTLGQGDTEWLTRAEANDKEFYDKLMGIYKTCAAKVKFQEDDDGCQNAYELAKCSRIEGIKVDLDKFFQ